MYRADFIPSLDKEGGARSAGVVRSGNSTTQVGFLYRNIWLSPENLEDAEIQARGEQ